MSNQTLKQSNSTANEVGSDAPGYTSELGERISSIISDIGSLKEAAAKVPCKPEQLAKWRDGKARMPLYAATNLCSAVNGSLDELVYGPEAKGKRVFVAFNYDKLLEAMMLIEELQEQNSLVFEPRDKAEMILRTYKSFTDSG